MRYLAFASAFMLAAAPALAGGTASSKTDKPMGMKLEQAECDKAWQQASAGKDMLGEGEARNYITDLSQVDAGESGTVGKSAFAQACEKGLINQTAIDSPATTGASSGTRGSSDIPKQKDGAAR